MKNIKLKVREHSLEQGPLAVLSEDKQKAWVHQQWDIVKTEGGEHTMAQVAFDSDPIEWGHHPTLPGAIAFRDRLIACWNACAGMDDPEKEVFGLKHIAALKIPTSN